MVRVQLLSTGEYLDLSDAGVTYVKQVGDLGDISTLNASYSWSMNAPKTPHNTKILNALGVKGDTSLAPYLKIYCRLIDNGVSIVSKGLLQIRETTSEYKLHIQEGIIEFFRDVSNDKIGEVLDLSELTHENDLPTIIDSFTQKTFSYLIADYMGPTLPRMNGLENINPNGLVPSVYVKWLLDKIFEHYGWTYSGDIEPLEDLWMTYPSALSFEVDSAVMVGQASATETYRNSTTGNYRRYFYPRWLNPQADPEHIAYASGKFTVLATGNYLISYLVSGISKLEYMHVRSDSKFYTRLIINNQIAHESISDEGEQNHQVLLNIGDTIEIEMFVPAPDMWRDIDIELDNDILIEIETIGLVEVDFRKALINYKVHDFFKEVMIRCAVTSFADMDTKHIEFIDLESRLNGDIVDWSDKYVSRDSESYVYNSYAQNNYLRHKYNEEGNDYADGNLRVSNKNLPVEKTLYQSKSYAAERVHAEVMTSSGFHEVGRFKMFETEVTVGTPEDEDAVVVKYKGLNDRYYFLRGGLVNKVLYVQGQLVPYFAQGVVGNQDFSRIVQQRYADMVRILQDTRIHSIRVALNRIDVANLDLSKRIFFKQENAAYILNRLTWKTHELAVGEFIRVKDMTAVDFEREVDKKDFYQHTTRGR